MKVKLLLTLFAACIISLSVSAQCSVRIGYSQNPGTTTVAFWPDSSTAGFLNNVSYTWSFGDGTSGSGTQVTHSYNGLTSYIVCLTMNDTTAHCTYTTCDTINLSNSTGGNCSAQIYYINTDSLYTFLDSANTGIAPFTYSWTLNGQIISTANSVTALIPDSTNVGIYEICLTVTDSTGCVAAPVCYNIYATLNSNCSSYASYANQDSLYTFSVSHIGTTPVSYLWDYNNTFLDSSANPTLVLDSAALSLSPTICVTVTDANGCTSRDCITLGNPAGGGGCQAYFVIYPDSVNGSAGYYLGYNFSSGNFGSNVLWDFGDGTTSTSPYPQHTYASPGQYTVCLTVGTAGTSCYDTYCDSSFYAFKTASGLMTHLSISSPTGIHETDAAAAISIYPNPVNDKLTISSAKNIDNERIFNIDGQLVFERKTGNEINVSKFPAGIYVLELSSNGVQSRTKFVKD